MNQSLKEQITIDNLWHTIQLPSFEANQNGYVYIFCSNGSDISVFFDDIEIEHKTGNLVEETHYYPFGQPFGRFTALPHYSENKILFTSQLYEDDEWPDNNGLKWYDFDARNYDPQIARWHCVDQLSEQFISHSPYHYSYNNPVSFIDPDGRSATTTGYNLWSNKGYYGRGYSGQNLSEATRELLYSDATSTAYKSFRPETAKILNYAIKSSSQFAQYSLNAETGEFTYKDYEHYHYDPGGYLGYATGIGIDESFLKLRSEMYGDAQGGGGTPDWVNNTIGAASATTGFFQAGYLNDANQTFKYAQRINGKVRSASTITRANRISSLSTAKSLSRVGGGLTFLAAGATVYDGLTGETGWQNHHTADLLVTGAIYGTAAAFPVVGWVAGGLYFAADLTFQYYTRKSITQNLFDQ